MMSVSGNIWQEMDFFLVSVLSGCLLVFVYDVLRVLRRLIPHGILWVALEDILYWGACAIYVFAMLYQKNDGLIRGFAIGAILLGMLIYNHFMSSRVINGVVWLIRKVMKIIGFPIRVLKKILYKPMTFCGRKITRIGKKQKKLLKKLYKAVRMILCKH